MNKDGEYNDIIDGQLFKANKLLKKLEYCGLGFIFYFDEAKIYGSKRTMFYSQIGNFF
jgi:hypothetical protein